MGIKLHCNCIKPSPLFLFQNSTEDSILDNPNLHFYQLVYGIIIVVGVILTATHCFFFSGVTLNAASKFHNTMFKNVKCNGRPPPHIYSLISKLTIHVLDNNVCKHLSDHHRSSPALWISLTQHRLAASSTASPRIKRRWTPCFPFT